MTVGPDGSDRPTILDLRLVAPAAGAWAAAALLLLRRELLAAGLAGAVLGAAVLCLTARRSAAAIVLLAGLAGAAGAGGITAVRLASVHAEPVAGMARAGTSVTVLAVLAEDPRAVPGPTGAPPLYITTVRATSIRSGRTAVTGDVPLLVFSRAAQWRALLPGQPVQVRGVLDVARPADPVSAVMSARGPPQLRGHPPRVQQVAGQLRSGLRNASDVLPDKARGLLPGLVVGDVSRLDPELREQFRVTGMSHLVAVSGANVAIVVGAVLLLCRSVRLDVRVTAVLAALALAGFVVLARPSPSVLRAATMGAIALAALVIGHRRAAVPSLAAAVLLLILFDPWLALRPGFALSVLATGGLLLLAPRWRTVLARRLPRWLADAIAVPAAASAACAPLVAALWSQVSLIAVPANLLAAPFVPPATVLGVLAAITAPWSLPVAEVLARLAAVPVSALIAIATVGSNVPLAAVDWPGGVAGAALLVTLLILLVVVARHRPLRRVAGAAIAGVVLGSAVLQRAGTSGWPPAGWLLVACDVGQGDMLVLSAGDGRAVVVDAGPDPALADRCLRDLDVRTVSLVVLTHLHADHVDGLPGVLRGRRVGAVQIGPLPEPATQHRAVLALARAHRVPVLAVRAGEKRRIGALSWRVLAPARTFSGTSSDPNNSSVVLAVRWPSCTALLTGDVEPEAQRALLADPAALRADVLKVPHHGSRAQDATFLAAVSHRLAITSSGADNDYGHPAPETLRRVRAVGRRVLRTDTDGTIAVVERAGVISTVTTGPRRVAVRDFRP